MKRRIRRIRRALKRAGLYNAFHITLIAVLLTGFCVILFNVKEPEQQEKEPEEIQAEVMQNPETMTQTAENIEDKYKVFDTMSEDWGSDDLEGFVFYDLPEQYADKSQRRQVMTLEELIDTLESANMLRIFKGDEEIFVGYLALFAPEVGHTNCKLYEQYKNDKVIRFRAVPEITHRKWKELNLMSPLKPDETPDFRFQELQMKLYYTIYL